MSVNVWQSPNTWVATKEALIVDDGFAESTSTINSDYVVLSSARVVSDGVCLSESITINDSISGSIILDINDGIDNSKSTVANDDVLLLGEYKGQESSVNSDSIALGDNIQTGFLEFKVYSKTNITAPSLSTNIDG